MHKVAVLKSWNVGGGGCISVCLFGKLQWDHGFGDEFSTRRRGGLLDECESVTAVPMREQ